MGVYSWIYLRIYSSSELVNSGEELQKKGLFGWASTHIREYWIELCLPDFWSYIIINEPRFVLECSLKMDNDEADLFRLPVMNGLPLTWLFFKRSMHLRIPIGCYDPRYGKMIVWACINYTRMYQKEGQKEWLETPCPVWKTMLFPNGKSH